MPVLSFRDRPAVHDDASPSASRQPTSRFGGDGDEPDEPPQHNSEHGRGGPNAQSPFQGRGLGYQGKSHL